RIVPGRVFSRLFPFSKIDDTGLGEAGDVKTARCVQIAGVLQPEFLGALPVMSAFKRAKISDRPLHVVVVFRANSDVGHEKHEHLRLTCDAIGARDFHADLSAELNLPMPSDAQIDCRLCLADRVADHGGADRLTLLAQQIERGRRDIADECFVRIMKQGPASRGRRDQLRHQNGMRGNGPGLRRATVEAIDLGERIGERGRPDIARLDVGQIDDTM
ncbi:MAG: hypothetical protein Q4F71_10775, partial [Paracoccus sp. (in: a-proteobacteria)]|nr:hypothetical protein [Paracoccus sp. (in: a-proteobacteria)]